MRDKDGKLIEATQHAWAGSWLGQRGVSRATSGFNYRDFLIERLSAFNTDDEKRKVIQDERDELMDRLKDITAIETVQNLAKKFQWPNGGDSDVIFTIGDS